MLKDIAMATAFIGEAAYHETAIKGDDPMCDPCDCPRRIKHISEMLRLQQSYCVQRLSSNPRLRYISGLPTC